jgi:hypothetical protein
MEIKIISERQCISSLNDHWPSLIDISLLIEVVDSYRLEIPIEELEEILRALDILGAETRSTKYAAVLYLKLREIERNENKWRIICGERLPVSFFEEI